MNTKISRPTLPLLLAASLALTGVAAFAQYSGSTRPYPPSPAPIPSDNPVAMDPSRRTDSQLANREFTMDQFKAVDTDYDGRISQSEFVSSAILRGTGNVTARTSGGGVPRSDETTTGSQDATARNTPALFRVLDKNKDGFLSPNEIAAYYQVEVGP